MFLRGDKLGRDGLSEITENHPRGDETAMPVDPEESFRGSRQSGNLMPSMITVETKLSLAGDQRNEKRPPPVLNTYLLVSYRSANRRATCLRLLHSSGMSTSACRLSPFSLKGCARARTGPAGGGACRGALPDRRRRILSGLKQSIRPCSTDVMLPGRSGLEILSTMRQMGLRIPVLVLTAKDTVDLEAIHGFEDHPPFQSCRYQ
jgi:CheY-like chemotaxis protein